ncbi:MAG: ATP-binding protein [Planctomycetaceae bacterium]|jgi:AAA15 family ATPase/GTPase|nr:ATP-binding protein [Planctomycetaceae bacterium]
MLSMLPINRLTAEDKYNETHIAATGHETYSSVLKTAVIYGANSSGKSNLLYGFLLLKEFLFNNLRNIRSIRHPIYDPFVLTNNTNQDPTLYEIQFLIGKYLYRYGFEVQRNYIESEWLYRNEKELFYRDGQTIIVHNSFAEGKGKESQTRPDALFLSVCHSYNGSISKKILDWFSRIQIRGIQMSKRIRIINTADHPANQYLSNVKIIERLKQIVKLADNGISDFHQREIDVTQIRRNPETNNFEPVVSKQQVFNAVYECEDKEIELELDKLSAGTLKMLYTAAAILQAIDTNGIVCIDEIDIQLHPLLIEELLNVFHRSNNGYAQLIFTAHNTYPLRKKLLRRDQVWFMDKNTDFSSRLTNFAEFKIPPDSLYEEDYLNGRFGGIPLRDFVDFIEENKNDPKTKPRRR